MRIIIFGSRTEKGNTAATAIDKEFCYMEHSREKDKTSRNIWWNVKTGRRYRRSYENKRKWKSWGLCDGRLQSKQEYTPSYSSLIIILHSYQNVWMKYINRAVLFGRYGEEVLNNNGKTIIDLCGTLSLKYLYK